MSAVTLTPRALYEEVAELLRQRIFRRELEPGSWIDELKLAEEYGIPQRITDSPSDGGEELLSRASEQKLVRAIDIGEEDEDEDDEEDEDEDEDEEK